MSLCPDCGAEMGKGWESVHAYHHKKWQESLTPQAWELAQHQECVEEIRADVTQLLIKRTEVFEQLHPMLKLNWQLTIDARIREETP